jgi:hypothetical protein
MRSRFRGGIFGSVLTIAFASATAASPQAGGLDAHGCHHNRKAGGYHCHRGQFAGQSFNSKDEMLQKLGGQKAETKAKPKSKE